MYVCTYAHMLIMKKWPILPMCEMHTKMYTHKEARRKYAHVKLLPGDIVRIVLRLQEVDCSH